jgi:hypothetical protein
VVIPLCGGNIDTVTLGRVIERGLAADGRLVRFVVGDVHYQKPLVRFNTFEMSRSFDMSRYLVPHVMSPLFGPLWNVTAIWPLVECHCYLASCVVTPLFGLLRDSVLLDLACLPLRGASSPSRALSALSSDRAVP